MANRKRAKYLRGINYKYGYSISGDVCSEENIVGYCWNGRHMGCITKRLAKAHLCIEKNCKFLEKTNKVYWKNREESVKHKKIYKRTHLR